MTSKIYLSRIINTGFPAAFGCAVAWLGVTLVKNEHKLLMRRLELEAVLKEKSRNKAKTFLNA